MEKRKSIAFYIGSLSRGGAERVIVNLAAYFQSQNYDVTIVTKLEDEDEYPVPSGVKRILADLTEKELKSSRIYNLYARIAKLRNIWKEVHPDCIVSFIKKNNFMALVSSRGLKIPVIVSVRSNPSREYPGFINKTLVKILFSMADKIVLQTRQAKKFFPEYIQKKSIILLNSISEQFLEERGRVDRKNEIVWVGRMDSNKNPKLLLDAFIPLASDYPDWKLKFIGSGYELEKMSKEVEENKLEKQIIFTGSSDKVADEIRQASIFVLTSKQEGMPNALIEAMVSGLAVIATDCPCGGPAELIQNEENGILIPVDDVTSLRNALDKLIVNEVKRKILAKKAEQLIDRVNPTIVNYQWKETIEKVIESQ